MARHRRKLEPISPDELLKAPGMSGFVSFLNVKPWESPAQSTDPSPLDKTQLDSTEVQVSAPESNPLDSRALESSTLDPSHLDSLPVGPQPTGPEADDGSKSSPLDYTALDYTDLESRPLDYRRPKVKLVVQLQDSLSHGEELLYNALWQNARPRNEESRIIDIGVGKMAEISRLAPANARLNSRGLLQKKVIEQQGTFSFRTGRTYIVYNFRAALRRQREAGLTHVIRNRGVVFVDPESGRELTAKLHVGQKQSRTVQSSPLDSESSPFESSVPRGVESSESSPLESSIPNRSSHITSQTSSLSAVHEALAQYVNVDDDAVEAIVRRCRQNAPEATDEEIAHFVHYKGRALPPRLDNPLGWLIVYVPKCFPGELLRMREQSRREAAELAQTEQEMTVYYRQVLQDPTAADYERRLAREWLHQRGVER